MIRDLGEASDAALPAYDLCIVGSGPAGMTLARELSDSGLRVCVLESGKLRTTRHGDALRAVRSDGIRIKDYSRERVLGGASTTWAGLSAPLDAVEMGDRPFLRLPGWPIARDELLPYWTAAAGRYRFAPLSAFGPDGFGAHKRRGDAQLSWRDVEEKIFLAASDPQDFGREHRDVFSSASMDLVLDATVLRLEGGGAAGAAGAEAAGGPQPATGALPRIARAIVGTSAGRELAIEARAFVLATGGIENARLLLNSRDVCAAGLGNEHDQVGRCLMNHPKNYYGVIRLARPVRELPYHFGCLYRGFAGYAGLRLREALQRERGCLNSYVRFEPLFPWTGSRGVESLVFLVKRSRLFFRSWKERRREELVELRDYSETGDDSDLQNERKSVLGWLLLFGTILVQLPTVLRYVVARLRRGAPTVRAVRLRNFMEMEPHPDNRVMLADERDACGQPIALVRHRPTDLDRRSLVALHQTLVAELRGNGFGELETRLAEESPWPIDQDASHHMGTTRMGRDPASSVVNADGRLHFAANVWVAGASVFPTSGCANPTFTLVALAIRLARHLREAVFADVPAPGSPARRGAAALPASATLLAPAPRSSAPRQRVLVIGAGERVQTDVLPVLERMADCYEIGGVFARSGGTIASRLTGARFATRGLDTLAEADLSRCDLVYVAVSKGSVPDVLSALTRHDVSRIDLLVETPVLLPRHLRHAARLESFRNAWVAEDCSTLPWLDVVRAAAGRGLLGELQQVICDRSAYRYHGLAMIKTLLGGGELSSARRERTGQGRARVELHFADGRRGVMIEPRDYARGTITLVGSAASVVDALPASGSALHLQAILARGAEGPVCAGFRIGDVTSALDEDESALIGPMQPGETITARMDTMKRAGLLRLLRAVHAGRAGYPLQEGLDDMAVDFVLDRARRWRKSPFTSVKSRVGRSVLSAVGRVAGRG